MSRPRTNHEIIPNWVAVDADGEILCPKNSINPGHWRATRWALSTLDRNVPRTCRCFDKITIFVWDDESPKEQ